MPTDHDRSGTQNEPIMLCRSSTEAILANVGVEESAFSKGAMDELPRLASPGDWQVPESEVKSRRDLRGEEYMICSIDPPGWPFSMMSPSSSGK